MYNESGFSLKNFILKALLVVLFVFVLMWLFPMPNMKPMYDRLFAENIETMKQAAKSYYTVDRLPKENDKAVKMTLDEMVSTKLVLPIVDSSDKDCDGKASYVEVIKTEDEYVFKTSLTCGNKTDYVVEHVGCYDVCGDKCKEEVVVEKPVPTTPTTPTVNKPTKPTVPTKPTKPVTPTKTKYVKVLYGKDTTTTDSSWVYQPIATGKTTNDGITTNVALIDSYAGGYNYVNYRESETIYSAGYIDATKSYPSTFPDGFVYPGPRLFNLANIGVSNTALSQGLQALDFKITSVSALNSIYDYQEYINTRNQELYPANGCAYCSTGSSASQMMNSALRLGSNFNIMYNYLEWNSYYNTYELITKVYINYTYNIPAYYDYSLGNSIFFVPYKFVVSWNEPRWEYYPGAYRYRTTVSYDNEWVSQGSSRERELLNRGYKAKETKEEWY